MPPITPAEGPELPELPAAPSFEHEGEEEKPAPPSYEPFEGVELPEAPVPEMPETPEPSAGERAVPEWMPETAPEMPSGFPEMPVFDRTIPEHEEALRKPVGPVFVSVDEYRTIMENSNRVKAKLSEAEDFLHRLEEIKTEEEKVFDRWRGQLEDVERKLGHIDRVIAKAKR